MMPTLLTGLVPEAALTAEEFGDVPDAWIFPEEEAVLSRAEDRRRREFATVRHCARVALTRLGRPAGPMVPGERGAPTWPEGVVGSMTHCDGYRAAAVSRRIDVAALGIDAEPHAPLPPGLLRRIASPAERSHLTALRHTRPTLHWDRLFFSAKESVYKAWFPLTGTWLDFREAELILDPYRQTFRARLLRTGHDDEGRPLHILHGRWRVGRRLVVTAVAHRVTASDQGGMTYVQREAGSNTAYGRR
ncbi:MULTISPECIES: 4'-phosphopantetheinyl transferase family protein [Streptomyces]|uniref:4'-phosphopantetheinyl transferase n=1 Tax=Streptomyces pseudovenezuelae TaxID=67350 RepID=A0A101NCW0_9ACTN|nr:MULTISPECIES: 4'-phosphopantetheinyl transferase superfamily protein [Streptomyces]KUM90819.1 4'-phosphopantetheinyl transferase [Streptomyces pseudovenezuelae]